MTGRDRRAVSVGVVVSTVAWICLRGAPWILGELRAIEEVAAQRADLLSRSEGSLAALGALADSVRGLQAAAAVLPGFLLVGEDAQTAAFDLMRRVRDRLAEQGVGSAQFSPHTDGARSGPLERVAISVSVEVEAAALSSLVSSLELDSGLAIERLDILAPQPDDTAARDVLRVDLVVSGWYRARETGTSEPAGAS